MKNKPVFGTQAQQDAAWMKATGAKKLPSAAELSRRRTSTAAEIEWTRKYQAMTYRVQFGT